MRAPLAVLAVSAAAAFAVACAAVLGLDAVSYGLADGGQPSPCPNGTWCDCEPPHALCLDFDRPLGLVAPAGRIYSFNVNGIGDAGVDDAIVVSAPGSLRTVAQTSADFAGGTAEIMAPFAGAARTTRLDFEVNLDRVSQGAAALAYLSFNGPGCRFAYCFLSVRLDTAMRTLELGEYFDYGDGGLEYIGHPMQATLASGAGWVHMTVTLTASGPKSVIGAAVGGLTALDASADDRFGGLPKALYLGLENVQAPPGEPWVVHFDNVTVDVGP